MIKRARCGYEGVEAPKNFPSRRELEDYRALLLQKTAEQVHFIRREFCPHGRKLRVLEFCCGNGRLLIALAQAGLLQHGLGIDVAASRIRFSRKWAAELGLRQIELHCDNVLTAAAPRASFDLAVCMTGAFQYFRVVSASTPGNLLSRMQAALDVGGQALLELYPLLPAKRRMFAVSGKPLRTWDPLPPEDRFAFYLHEQHYYPKEQTVRHDKIFVGRDGTIDVGRSETLTYYDKRQIRSMMQKAGFGSIRFFPGFSPRNKIECMVVTAGRKN